MKTYISALSILVGVMLLAGCDVQVDSSRETTVVITPSAASISRNGTVDLVASQGANYKWSLEKEEWGNLSTRSGERTTYRSVYDPGTNSTVVQVVKVTSSPQGTTTSNSFVHTAEAYISHVGYGLTNQVTGLVLSPAEATIKKDQMLVFNVTPANLGQYEWKLSEPSLGLLSKQDAHASYTGTRDINALQVITVSSPGYLSASAVITHTLSNTNNTSGKLTISPATGALEKGEGLAISVAPTDRAKYSWTLSDPSLGILSATNTYAAFYTSTKNANAVQIITVSSPGLTSVTAAITHQHTALAITPPSASVPTSASNPTASRSFTATGGDGSNYAWSLSPTNTQYNLSTNSGPSVLFISRSTATIPGLVELQVSSGGETATALITIQRQ